MMTKLNQAQQVETATAQQDVRNEEVHQSVRQHYGEIATTNSCGCGPSCCSTPVTPEDVSLTLGYTSDDVNFVPEGANMGLGCGNPQAIAGLKTGETVLDLGSGGGFDCFLASRQVGDTGHVIGVDMTPEMISKSRKNALQGEYHNVEFRLGEIENLPVANNSVDCIISNCVINLSPSKRRVFAEAFRVLAPGGRLAISDIVATAELPLEMQQDMSLLTGCMAGAALITEIESMLLQAGFIAIQISPKSSSQSFIREWAPGTNVTDYVVSATIEAVKPII